MSHAPHDTHGAEPTVQIDDPEAGSTWFISIAGSFVFAALVLAISVVYFMARNDEATVRVIDERVRSLESLRASQRLLLAEKGAYTETLPDGKEISKIRIPIERAMDLTAQELAPRATTAVSGGGSGT